MTSQNRNGFSLLETILAAALTAAVLVSTVTMMRSGMQLARRQQVTQAMTRHAAERLDALHIHLGDANNFRSAARGALDTSFDSQQRWELVPGEWVEESISIDVTDSSRSLLEVTLNLQHTQSGLRKKALTYQVHTHIAEPW